MRHLNSASGSTVSYDRYGSGPPLVLVHGSFSDHRTNWELVRPMLAERFTVYALARRGRGETDATESHGVRDEAGDLSALLDAIDEPAFVLGHSYGAHVVLAAVTEQATPVARLVLYEPPRPDRPEPDAMERLEKLASNGRWDEVAAAFFRDTLLVPGDELDKLRATEDWSAIVADARASLGDARALTSYDFDLEKCRNIQVAVLLQYGSESPREVFLTDALAAVLPNAQVEALPGQAHEGMRTAPELYVNSVSRFLLT